MAEGLLDAKYAYEIALIEGTYGQTVSFDRKRKSLRKFGENYDLDVGTREDVWYSGGEEVLPTTNAIDSISSSSTSDTAKTIRIEGHYFDASDNKIFIVQDAVLNGQNRVALTTPLCRATRSYTLGSSPTIGNIYVYQNTAIVAGVPTDRTKLHIEQPVEYQQTLKCMTSVSYQDFWLIEAATFSVLRANAASVDFTIWIREKDQIFRPTTILGVSSNGSPFLKTFTRPIIVPSNADVKVTAETNANNTSVAATLDGPLGIVTRTL